MDMTEKIELYQSLMERLTASFPKGTVDTNNRASIPVQVYIQRLEEVVGPLWSWQTKGDPLIFETENQVQVKGILKILDAEREGTGLANLQRYSDSGKISNLKHAILSAESDALRKACDKFRMGWIDLAPYRDWSKNPGVRINADRENDNANSHGDSVSCVKCNQRLTNSEMNFLKENDIRINYCKNDIPEQLLKKKGR